MAKGNYRVISLGTCGGAQAKEDRVVFDKAFDAAHYNPITMWNEKAAESEREVKNTADVIAFLLSPGARTLTVVVELSEMIATGRRIVLVPGDDLKVGAEISNEPLSPADVATCNAVRKCAALLAKQAGVPVFGTAEEAAEYIQEVGFEGVPQAELQVEAINEDVVAPLIGSHNDQEDALKAIEQVVKICLAAGAHQLHGTVTIPDLAELKANSGESRYAKDIYRFFVYFEECLEANGVGL